MMVQLVSQHSCCNNTRLPSVPTFTMADENTPAARDLTLSELLEEPELCLVGMTERGKRKEAVIDVVEAEKKKLQDKADLDEICNMMVLFKIKWDHKDTNIMPKEYRGSEWNRTTLQKLIVENLGPWKDQNKLPFTVEFASIDVNPLGVVFDCSPMPHDQVELILANKKFNVTLQTTMECDNAWGGKAKLPEQVTLTIGSFATENSEKHVFSITFPAPMNCYTVTSIDGQKHKVVRPPTPQMVEKAFEEFGVPIYRSDTTTRDQYYLDESSDQMVVKNRWTAFYDEPPTQTIPLFYTVVDANGDVVGAWNLTTKCFKREELDICDFCHQDLKGMEDGDEHECHRVGNLIPSFKKAVTKRKLEVKQKNLRTILKEKREEEEMRKRRRESEAVTPTPSQSSSSATTPVKPASKKVHNLPPSPDSHSILSAPCFSEQGVRCPAPKRQHWMFCLLLNYLFFQQVCTSSPHTTYYDSHCNRLTVEISKVVNLSVATTLLHASHTQSNKLRLTLTLRPLTQFSWRPPEALGVTRDGAI